MGNDEIKEILDKLIKDENVQGFIISDDLFKKLKNYITTLEQAVKDTKDSYGNMVFELQQENERLKDGWQQEVYDKNEILNRWYELQGRIEKAIEYIKNIQEHRQDLTVIEYHKKWLEMYDYYESVSIMADLLNILQNGSDKE